MPSSPAPSNARVSPARTRLLAAASAVFYADGVHSVGVDRIIREAGVTRATFYRHFPSKEDLVLAYVRQQDAAVRERAAAVYAEVSDPRAVLRAIVAGIADQVDGGDFRGCPFINVAAEYPDPSGPVRQAIESHRAWMRDDLVTLLTGSGHDDPAFAADLLMMLRDGAQVAGYLGDPALARASFERAAAGVVT